MKVLSLFVFTWSILSAQTAPAPDLPDLPDKTVIAVFDDGVPFTMGEFKKLYAVLPPTNQQGALRDRKNFLEQYALMRKLVQMAEKEKLDQESPNKEALEWNRFLILGQARMNKEVMSASVEPDDIGKYYEANKDRYKQVRVKAIYISFTKAQASQFSNGKRLLTEEEAKAKALKLLADIRGGADFVKLARENSDDTTSRDKDGDFATLQPTDGIPDAIKNAVFALKQGEVTEPVQQPNGFYLLRAEEISYKSQTEIRSELVENLRQEHFRQWMEQLKDSVKLQLPSPAFLGVAPAPPPLLAPQ
jgi:peptidyl-prolyl cis-trans isomerase C